MKKERHEPLFFCLFRQQDVDVLLCYALAVMELSIILGVDGDVLECDAVDRHLG